MHNTLIIFLRMDPYPMYSSYFGDILLDMILYMLTQFHVFWGNAMVLKVVHISQGIGHFLQGTFGILFHAWTSSTHATLETLEHPPFSLLFYMFLT
jgi:hypothetical protein